MKVAIVNHWSPDFPGGAEVWVRALCQGLEARGHSCEVFTPDAWRKEGPGRIGVPVVFAPGRLVRLAAHLGLSGFDSPLFNPKVPEDCAVIYSTSALPFGLALRNRQPMIFGTHDAFVPNELPGIDSLQLIPIYALRLIRRSRRVSIHTLTPTQTARFRRARVPIREIPPDIVLPPDVVRPSLAPEFRVLYLGRIERRKGAGLLLRVAKAIGRIPGVTLSIAGRCPPEFELELRESRVDERVRLLGYVTDAERDRLLETSDALLLLSDREAAPLVAFEAWARGVVVISTWRAISEIEVPDGSITAGRTAADVLAAVQHLQELWRTDPEAFLSRKVRISDHMRAAHDPRSSMDALIGMLEGAAMGIPLPGATEAAR